MTNLITAQEAFAALQKVKYSLSSIWRHAGLRRFI